MSTANKIYYDVNIANQTIIGVASKPVGCPAEVTISRIHQLMLGVTERNSQPRILSNAEQRLTPGYTLLYIRNRLSSEPIPTLEHRAGYNLWIARDSITPLVQTIIDQYKRTYDTKVWFFRKWFDRLVV